MMILATTQPPEGSTIVGALFTEAIVPSPGVGNFFESMRKFSSLRGKTTDDDEIVAECISLGREHGLKTLASLAAKSGADAVFGIAITPIPGQSGIPRLLSISGTGVKLPGLAPEFPLL